MDLNLLEEFKNSEIIIERNIQNRAVLILYDKNDPTLLQTGNFYAQLYQGFVPQDSIWLMSAKLTSLARFINENKEKRMIVHYVGHGVNSGGKFPSIYFEGHRYNIVNVLKEKPFDLLLMIDACNVLPHGRSRCVLMTRHGIDVLFSLNGFNVISSSRRGNFSYFVVGQHTLFFEAFEAAISSPLENIKDLIKMINHSLVQLYKKYALKFPDDGRILEFELHDNHVDHKDVSCVPPSFERTESGNNLQQSLTRGEDIKDMNSVLATGYTSSPGFDPTPSPIRPSPITLSPVSISSFTVVKKLNGDDSF